MRIVVVGGGISGLTAAWAAATLAPAAEVVVFEGSPRIGGKLRVDEVGGVPVDVGAEALLTARPEGLDLLREAGLGEQMIIPLTTAAQVHAGGRNHPLPTRTMLGIPADLDAARASGLLTEPALRAIETEPRRAPLAPLTEDIAVGALVRDRLGDEVLDRLVEPLLGGVYAGRADALSLRATMGSLAARLGATGGSLVQAARAVTDPGTRGRSVGPMFTTLSGGLGRLPERLAASGQFTVRISVPVRALSRTPRGFVLTVGSAPEPESVEADAVIVAVPVSKAARLLHDVCPVAAGELSMIETASMAIVSFAFAGVSPPPGSGLLVASGERRAVKAITVSSQKWPIAPAGLTLLRASVGRVGEPQALQLDDADLIALVRRELAPLLGIDVEPIDSLVTRWGGGLPQYAVGHVERIARVRAAVHAVPGLAVCGAAFDGLGVPACIATARDAVDRVLASLPRRGQ